MVSRLTGLFKNNAQSKAADALRAQDTEGKLAALDLSQAIIEFELNGTIIHANDNFLSVMGYRLEEIKGQHHSLFVEPSVSSGAEYQQFWQRLNRGEFVAEEFKRIGKGGAEVWIQASYNPILDAQGKPFKVVKFATDITDRKMRDADITGQLQAIQKSTAVIEFNLDGTILTANDHFLQAVGYQLNEVQGKPHRMFVETELASSAAYQAFWEQLRRGEYQAGEFKRIGKGGREVWIQASYNPIMDANGQPFKVVKYASDITAQKQLQQTVEAVLAETKKAIFALAQGDLTIRMNGQFTGQFAEFQKVVNEFADRMHDALTEIHTVASNVAAESTDIAQGTSHLSERSIKQAANLEETAASMEEITATVQDNAANASTANELALAASEQARKGGDIVRNAVQAMNGLNESSGKISEIIGVINDIAFQTNLLALNASVEAARAGSQGRGFAVVASEVRDLAGRSATAAKEIRELIEDSANRVTESSQLVNQSGDSLGDIVAGVEKVTDIIGQISVASSEQSLGISSANNAITQIDVLTQQNASLVEQTTASSQTINSQTSELAQLIASFKLHDNPQTTRRATGMAANEPAHPSSVVPLRTRQ